MDPLENTQHPTEPILEAILQNQDDNAKTQESILEAILIKTVDNNNDDILEQQIIQSEKNTDRVVKAIESTLKTEDIKDGMIFSVKGVKGDKGDKGDTGESVKGDKGDKGDTGDTGDKGDKGKDGKDGLDGLDGKDGKDGKTGAKGPKGDKGDPGKDGKSIPEELVTKISKTLKDTEKNLLYYNTNAVKSVIAGSNVTINNTDPQNPIVSSTASGTVQSVVAGTNITVNNTDPYNPIINASGSANIYNEVPTGLINSSNTVFTTSQNFNTNTTRLYLNGVRQQLNSGLDYTETGTNQVTFVTAPSTLDTVVIDYEVNSSVESLMLLQDGFSLLLQDSSSLLLQV